KAPIDWSFQPLEHFTLEVRAARGRPRRSGGSPSGVRQLGCHGFQPLLEGRRQRQRKEIGLRVEGVLSRGVDDAEEALCLRRFVGQTAIDLEDLQVLGTVVRDTNEEMGRKAHGHSRNRLILSRLRPIPWASYQ